MTDNNEKNQMSPFCEALMEKTASLAEMRQPCDTALVICTDCNTVACRQTGTYDSAVRMLLAKAIADDKFAELLVETSMRYSRYLNSRKAHDFLKEDAPASIKPIN